MNEIRPDLTSLPARMRGLPIDPRGYPIPKFVETMPDGSRDFRFMSRAHRNRCLEEELCWVCGERLGRFLAFVVGPMCGINRTSSEPPCHYDCATWSAVNCPFLSKPRVVRREDELTAEGLKNVAGCPILRNPGCAMVWITADFSIIRDGRGGLLVAMGEPLEVLWYAEGRKATRAEVEASITSGLPSLMTLAEQEGAEAVAALMDSRARFDQWLPVE